MVVVVLKGKLLPRSPASHISKGHNKRIISELEGEAPCDSLPTEPRDLVGKLQTWVMNGWIYTSAVHEQHFLFLLVWFPSPSSAQLYLFFSLFSSPKSLSAHKFKFKKLPPFLIEQF